MDTEEFELEKTDSICKSPESQLLDYVTNNESISKIESFINDNPEVLISMIGHPYNKPILYIACYELASTVSSNIVETLIKSGADLYYVDELHGNKQALHFAALGGNPQILQIIIKSLKLADINLLSNGDTALNLLIKEGDSKNPDFIECIKLLIQAGTDVNIPDSGNITPILWAAKKGYKDVEKLLCESEKKIDVESHRLKDNSVKDQTAAKGSEDILVSLPLKSDNDDNSNNLSAVLFNFLKEHKEEEFINCKYLGDFADCDDGELTLLQSTTEKGLTRAVKTLLSFGANPNKVTTANRTTPIEIAAMKEYPEIFVILLEEKKTVIPSHILMRIIVRDGLYHSVYYSRLMQHKNKFDLNISDVYGNTALHYAILFGGSEKTLDLLRAGASLASRNNEGISPVNFIDANILETHLDECLDANLEADIYNEMFIAHYNYTTLFPPKSINNKDKHNINEDMHDAEVANKLISKENTQLTSEISVFSSISNSEELKHLLKHPVLTSFVYMKWHRIRWMFYINLIFYVTFCVSLTLYILIVYSNQDIYKYRTVSCILLGFVWVTFFFLVVREFFQFVVTPIGYFYDVENWFELTLIVLTAIIILKTSPLEPLRKQLSAFAILSAAFVFIMTLGQHPEMSTNVTMFRTVSFNFFKFLTWYSVLIVAFAFSFYTLFRDTNDETRFFMDPGLSLFKTIIMLTGEFDASNIRFQAYPITSHIIFMLFVFMVAIVLFNLLNGLAVNDTKLIKSDSELIGHIVRIRHINLVENIMLSGFLLNIVIPVMQKYCCCLWSNVTRKTMAKRLIKYVFLFPRTLKCYRTGVFPNRAMIVMEDEDIETTYTISLDRQTAKRTKQLIRRKKEILEQEKKERSVIEMQKSIIEMQERVMGMQELLRKEQQIILKKLDSITNSNEAKT